MKLALARKESEPDQTQIPRVITPDKVLRRKSLGVSKSANTRQFQTKHKPSLVDDVNSIEVTKLHTETNNHTHMKLIMYSDIACRVRATLHRALTCKD